MIALAAFCLQHGQLLPTSPRLCCVMVGLCLAAASWKLKTGLLVTFSPSQPVACLHHLQLLPAEAWVCCVMVGMRLAAASWQSKNCLLRYSCSNSEKDVLRGCAGVGRFVPDPVPYLFQACTSHVPPLTHSQGEEMADILACVAC